MKERYKYIHFVKIEDKPKTSVWACRNNRSEGTLGWIEWYSYLGCYVFTPRIEASMFFSADCLADIIDFTKQCMEARP